MSLFKARKHFIDARLLKTVFVKRSWFWSRYTIEFHGKFKQRPQSFVCPPPLEQGLFFWCWLITAIAYDEKASGLERALADVHTINNLTRDEFIPIYKRTVRALKHVHGREYVKYISK